MSVSLKKGERISLSKESKGLSNITVGLGWHENDAKGGNGGFFGKLFGSSSSSGSSYDFDCDASALLLEDGKFVNTRDLVYFGNLRHISGAVNHSGDNLTGGGDSANDSEQIKIELDKVPNQFDKIVIVANIYQAKSRKQHFGMIKNAFIRIVDEKTGTEMCRYDLTDDYSGKTTIIFGEIYRDAGEWKFNAIGNGTTDGNLTEITNRFR